MREILGLSFWAHSLFLWNKTHLGNYVSEINVSRLLFNGALLGFIFFYSYFSKRGWLSVAWDLGFVYGYPFIVTRRTIWFLSKSFWDLFKRNTVIPNAGSKVFSSLSTLKELSDKKKTEKEKPRISVDKLTWKLVFRPVMRFTILWAFLVHTTSYRPGLICIAVICIAGAARSLWYLHDLLSDTSDWTGRLRGNFATTMAAEIAKMRRWESGMQTADVERSATNLRVWEAMFSFIAENKVMLSRFTWAGAVLVSIPFYAYVSTLFASAYYAVARAQHLQWSWSSALLDSLYMPFAFTDLPSSIPIRFVAGLQAIAVSIIGWNVFIQNFNNRFESLAKAAVELQQPLTTEDLRMKVQVLELEIEKNKLSQAATKDADVPVTSISS